MLDNQKEYWDKVANTKTFTHPADPDVISKYFDKSFRILDYGCGYGRMTAELYNQGFTYIKGVDTSAELIKRGKTISAFLDLIAINTVQELNNLPADFDAVLLFAVLTCIPSNAGQKELLQLLSNRLRNGGLVYISDYYLQTHTSEVKQYTNLNNDPTNYGVFTLKEGVTFRHHTKEWIKELLSNFVILSEKIIDVKTMNGSSAEAFQIVAQKNNQAS